MRPGSGGSFLLFARTFIILGAQTHLDTRLYPSVPLCRKLGILLFLYSALMVIELGRGLIELAISQYVWYCIVKEIFIFSFHSLSHS